MTIHQYIVSIEYEWVYWDIWSCVNFGESWKLPILFKTSFTISILHTTSISSHPCQRTFWHGKRQINKNTHINYCWVGIIGWVVYKDLSFNFVKSFSLRHEQAIILFSLDMFFIWISSVGFLAYLWKVGWLDSFYIGDVLKFLRLCLFFGVIGQWKFNTVSFVIGQ
jgi:hypothetical protein